MITLGVRQPLHPHHRSFQPDSLFSLEMEIEYNARGKRDKIVCPKTHAPFAQIATGGALADDDIGRMILNSPAKLKPAGPSFLSNWIMRP